MKYLLFFLLVLLTHPCEQHWKDTSVFLHFLWKLWSLKPMHDPLIQSDISAALKHSLRLLHPLTQIWQRPRLYKVTCGISTTLRSNLYFQIIFKFIQITPNRFLNFKSESESFIVIKPKAQQNDILIHSKARKANLTIDKNRKLNSF